MGDKIDRDAVIAAAQQASNDSDNPQDVVEAIRALPAASAEDVRAGALREAAAVAYPPLMHRKGKVGLWRQRRAQIAADILALIPGAKP